VKGRVSSRTITINLVSFLPLSLSLNCRQPAWRVAYTIQLGNAFSSEKFVSKFRPPSRPSHHARCFIDAMQPSRQFQSKLSTGNNTKPAPRSPLTTSRVNCQLVLYVKGLPVRSRSDHVLFEITLREYVSFPLSYSKVHLRLSSFYEILNFVPRGTTRQRPTPRHTHGTVS